LDQLQGSLEALGDGKLEVMARGLVAERGLPARWISPHECHVVNVDTMVTALLHAESLPVGRVIVDARVPPPPPPPDRIAR
jgi:hypothetical protein